MEIQKIKSAVETILFANGDPMKISKLAKIIEIEKEKTQEAIEELIEDYKKNQSGLIILKLGEEIQLASNPENGKYVEQLMKSELSDSLSPAALEVLSIVAYRGPISKPEIEAIRGVNCNYTIRNLLIRGLINKSDNPSDGRGFVYSITFDLLKKMGIDDIEKLPQYDILSKDERINSIVGEN